MEKKQILQQALMNLNGAAQSYLSSLQDACFTLEKSSAGNNLVSSQLTDATPILIQSWAPQKDIGALIAQLKAMPGKAVLFADFVNPVMAEKLRQRSIPFVDCAGNMSFKAASLNLFVKGRKLHRLRSKRMRGRAFNSAGLKLIFALFNEPRFLHASYREISNKVNIALGSVGPVMDDLYASGYILDEGDRRLVNKKRLFERWVDGYLEKLRPKRILACYTAEDKDWWKTADPASFFGLWGGEVVVARSTPFMTPETITMYFSSDKKQQTFAEHFGLIPDDEGEICMYKSFWSPSYAGNENIDGLSPMIVYADIVDSINPGSWDVAKTFYGEAVAHLLQD